MARKWWTLISVCTGVFMLLLDLTIVNVALPNIQHAFHASLSDLQWTIDAYALTLAAFLLMAGSLADLFGRRLLFAIGLAVFTAGSFACGLASGPVFLVLARAGQGVGGAIMFATSLALIAQAFHGRDRAVAFGVLGAITGVGVAVGPVLGGVLTSGLSWRWIFFVNIPVGIAALIVTLRKVEESRNPFARRPDVPGFLTFSTGLAALTYGLIRSAPDGWGSTTVIVSLTAAVALLAAFVVVELVQREPMFDLGLVRKPTFDGALLAALAINGSLFSLLTYLILYFEQTLGLSAAQTGVRFLPLTGAIFVASGIAGRLEREDPRAHADRARLRAGRRRAPAHARSEHRLDVDPPACRDGRRRHRRRLGQCAACGRRDRHRRARARRHGVGHQHDVPSGGNRHRRRRARRDLRPPPARRHPGRAPRRHRERTQRDPTRGSHHRLRGRGWHIRARP